MPKTSCLLLAISALALTSLPSFASGRCDARVSQVWNADATHKFTLEAVSSGPNCAKAVVVLVVRDIKGEVQWTMVRLAKYVATFGSEQTRNGKDMPAALTDWLDIGLQSKQKTMAELPDWKKAADGPADDPPSEFPFTVSDELNRETYLAWRKAKLPFLCFVQGMESLICITVTDQGNVAEVGIQSFPG
jgi:hypothetical protein